MKLLCKYRKSNYANDLRTSISEEEKRKERKQWCHVILGQLQILNTYQARYHYFLLATLCFNFLRTKIRKNRMKKAYKGPNKFKCHFRELAR